MAESLAAGSEFEAVAVVLLLVGGTIYGTAVWADDYQEGSRLYKEGKRSEALDRLESYLAQHPKDARARFLKGVVLTEQNKNQDAIKVFTELTQDYPELPEPYNNLAVLYAGQGDYDKARKSLEMAIRTHPSYAVAHENLGDIVHPGQPGLRQGSPVGQRNATARKLVEGCSRPRPRCVGAGGAAPKPAVVDNARRGNRPHRTTRLAEAGRTSKRPAAADEFLPIRLTRCSKCSMPGPTPGPATTPTATGFYAPSFRRPTARHARIGKLRGASGWPNRRKST
jgi:tetratricopeptide (TPR) repeat protein